MHSANNSEAFVHETLHPLGDKRVALVRADRGFCGNGFLETLENKQLHFAADRVCLNNFWDTEATLNVVMMAYNLMSLFRQAGYLNHEGRKDILKLAVAIQHRKWLSGLWERSKTFDLPVHFSLLPALKPAS